MFSSLSLTWRYWWHWFWLSLRNSQIFEFTDCLGSSQQFCKLSTCFWHFELLLFCWCNFKHCINSQYCLWHAKSDSHLVGVDILVHEKVRSEKAAKFKTFPCHTLDPEKRRCERKADAFNVMIFMRISFWVLVLEEFLYVSNEENWANIYFQS